MVSSFLRVIICAKWLAGVLLRCSDIIQERLAHLDELPTDESEIELEYPLTPPLSEPSDSRSHSPDFRELPIELNVMIIRSFKQGVSRKSREVAVRRRVHRRSQLLQPKRDLNLLFTDKHSTGSPLTLHIISRSASKPAIASAARYLLGEALCRRQKGCDQAHAEAYQLSIPDFNSMLEGKSSLHTMSRI